jgi:hypothetical protein
VRGIKSIIKRQEIGLRNSRYPRLIGFKDNRFPDLKFNKKCIHLDLKILLATTMGSLGLMINIIAKMVWEILNS